MADETEQKQTDRNEPAGVHTTASREAKRCREKDCKHPYRAKGYCVKHYRMWRQGTLGKKQRYKTCGKEGCRKPMVRRGLCEEHFNAASSKGETPAAAAGAGA